MDTICPSELISISKPSMADISFLPGEILQKIFMHLDGCSITLCKSVCKIWRYHVEYLIQKPSYWLDRCLDEIPKYALLDLLDTMFPSHSQNSGKNKNSVNWFEIYQSRFKWHVFHLSEKVNTIKMALGLHGISAIKVSGQWLLVSTCDGRGRLLAFNLKTRSSLEEVPEVIYVGAGAISNFELVNSSDSTVVPNVPSNELLERLFSTMGHNEIWLELKDCYIQLGRSYRYPKDKIRQRISHSYGYKLTLLKNHGESTLILNKISKNIAGPEIMELSLIEEYSEIIQFWGNKVCLGQQICECGHCLMKPRPTCCQKMQISTMTIDMKRQAIVDMEMTTFSTGPGYLQLASWQATVFFGCFTDRKLVSYMFGERRYQDTSKNEGCISCCHFYSEYLFMGTDRGLLLVFLLGKPEEGESHPRVTQITPYQTDAKKIRLPYCRITSITVAEAAAHGGRFPQVICASADSIYIVSIEKGQL